MNSMQIKCFLAVADTLNFTKAAAQLYISQPGLSKQIVSLERELNTVLFIREKQKVRLTPAAILLNQELLQIDKKMDSVIEEVSKVGQGYNGNLVIGVLNGQWLGELFSNTVVNFIKDNPNISISFKQGSFVDLRTWLETGEIDIAITIIMDIAKIENIQWKKFYDDKAYFAISKNLPVSSKKIITWDDLKQETFIAISREDSETCYEVCQKGFFHNNFDGQIKYVPNLATVMMLIEAGQGFGIINNSSSITMNPSIRIITEIQLGGPNTDGASCCMAWKKKNINPVIQLFTQYN